MNKYRTELLKRFDKRSNCEIGKSCGDVCIPKKNKCNSDRQNAKISPESTITRNLAIAGIAGIGTAIGISALNMSSKQSSNSINIPEYKDNVSGDNIQFVDENYLESRKFYFNENKNKNHAKDDSAFWVNDEGEELFVKKSGNKNRSVSEAIVSSVGKSVGIPINDVTISINKNNLDELPSTIHDVVPGKTIHQLSKETGEFKDIADALKQGLHPSSLQSVINSHPDLAKILALDVYTRNTDIHGGNILFDQKSNKAYAIDKGLAFSDPEVVNNFVSEFIQLSESGEINQSSADKRKNLKLFIDTLKDLSASYPSGTLSSIELNTKMKMGSYGKLIKKDRLQQEFDIARNQAKKLVAEGRSAGGVILELQKDYIKSSPEKKAAIDYTVSAYREQQSFEYIQKLIKYYEGKFI